MKASAEVSCVFTVVLLFWIHPVRGTKIWHPRVEFMNPANWAHGVIPTHGQVIVFPRKLNALVGLPEGILSTSWFILPQQGGLLLPDHSFSLNILSVELPEVAVAVFKAPGRTPYYAGDNWVKYDEIRATRQLPNAAVPHSERIPCQYEEAVFEVDNSIPKPVDMQYHESIVLGNVRFGDAIEGVENFQHFISSELGQFLFYNAEDTLIRQGKCANAEKCPCQEERQMDAICSNTVCATPHCLSPIRPSGHCCPICGSVFRMDMASFSGAFNLQSFTDKLSRKIAAEVEEVDVEYHVGIDRSAGANVVQLIIVDKDEYGERSVRMMNSLRPFFEKQFSSGFLITHAGQPHTPFEAGQLLGFLLFTMIATSTFFSALYVYHYDDTLLPRLRAAIRNRQFFTTPFVFARFDPNSEGDGLSVDVNFASGVETVNEAREDTVATVVTENASSFDNPMFEQSSPKVDTAAEAFDDVELSVK
uniref:Protein amnionless n=1 Tax=Anopheles farauti TaxID=69004 RepID=A0A182QM44_9DIPT